MSVAEDHSNYEQKKSIYPDTVRFGGVKSKDHSMLVTFVFDILSLQCLHQFSKLYRKKRQFFEWECLFKPLKIDATAMRHHFAFTG